MTEALAERFWSKVDQSGGPDACWPWTAYVGGTGYGQFWDGTRLVKAHRFAFLIANCREAEGDADHTCHNGSGCKGGKTCAHRRCANPSHLEAVTHQVNADRGETGRHSNPWKTHCIHNHKYTPENQYIDGMGHQRCRRCASNRYQNRKAAA